ncbi:MAG: COG1361 S-layer family protein [Nanobdellota archaeon]
MKGKLMLLTLVLALTLMTMPMVQAQDNAQLTVDMLKYEPMPAQPGQYVTVTLELENLGNEEADNAAIEVVDQFPFTIISEEEAKKIIGNLKAQRSYVVDLKLKVSSEAVVGDNELKIRYTTDVDNAPWQETTEIIKVKSNQAAISVIDVNTEPEEFMPGGKGDVKLTVKNTADVVLRDISVQLNLIRQENQKTIELPFTPTGTSEEQRINKLNPGELNTLTYTLNTDAETTPGYYKIPVRMNFFDEEGTETEKINIIGISVKAEPELKIILDKTTITSPEQQGTITVKFVNKGIHGLKFLDVELLDGEGYTVLSNKEDYIGDLDSDDYRTQDFTIKTTGEDITLDIATSYRDDNNNEYEKTFEVPMRYKPQPQNGNGGLSPTIIVIAVVVIFFIVRGIRKHRKKKKQQK